MPRLVLSGRSPDAAGVIDLADFSPLPPCLTGPGPTTCLTGCDVFDLDADHDVDLTDLAGFQRAFGPTS